MTSIVYPNVDYAFIVVLLKIVIDMNYSNGVKDNIISAMQIITTSIG